MRAALIALALVLALPACRDARDPVLEPVGAARIEALRGQCAASGGRFVQTGSGTQVCARQTRDSGMRCTRAGDCAGECLARSMTCAPVTPLFGCHEVLNAEGGRQTVCLE